MLTYLTFLLVCLGTQPCQSDVNLGSRITHLAPLTLINHQQRPDRQTFGLPRPLLPASERRSVLSHRVFPSTPWQPRLSQGPRRNTSRAMLICAGVVAGFYAGAAIGAAIDDHPDKGLGTIGMPVGGAIGGLIVWRLVK